MATSIDGGESWKSTPFDFGHLSPGGAQDPYTVGQVAWCYPNFIARPDGAMAFSMSMRYSDWDDWMQQDQSRPGVRDVMVRSLDGGKDRFFSAYTIMSEPAGNRRLGSCEGFFWSLTRGPK